MLVSFRFFVSVFSYQSGPETYLLQLRDVSFPVRLREYMNVAKRRSPSFALSDTIDFTVSIGLEFEYRRLCKYLSSYHLFAREDGSLISWTKKSMTNVKRELTDTE